MAIALKAALFNSSLRLTHFCTIPDSLRWEFVSDLKNEQLII